MATLSRTAFGLVVGGIALALVLTAGGLLYQAYEQGGPAATDTRTPRVRAYSVEVGTLEAQTIVPQISVYGYVVSGRTLELRSAVAGALIEISPNVRDGGSVAQGEVLFRIDPAKLESALALAKSDVAEAEADLSEARSSLELARLEADAAQQQFDLRDQAVARQEDLKARGVATEAAVETAVLARAAAEQTLINRRQAAAAAEARVAQAEITVSRRQIALSDAGRALDDATIVAPFAGVINQPDAIEGRLVAANEVLATLIDPAAMEVSFRVTNTQYARLLNDAGNLRKTEISIIVQSGRETTEIPATLERVGAEVGDGQIGRLVYARLTNSDPALVRPGDFVTVTIPERPLSDVALIPASAATADGRILLIGDGNRLEEIEARLLRQQGDNLIVGDVPFGRQYVLVRALELGPGIQVEPIDPAADDAAVQTDAEPETPVEPDTIALDDDRRAAIIDFINASPTMKPEMREKFLQELALPEVPRATVEKFETNMAANQ